MRSKPFMPWEQAEIPLGLIGSRVDLFHAPTFYNHPLIHGRFVVTVHDLILKRFPEFLPSIARRAYYKLMTESAVRGAARIITVSEFTRRDMIEFWESSAPRLRAIPNGVSDSFKPVEDREELTRVRERYQLPERFILYVGTCKRHKNLPRLLDAYGTLPATIRRAVPLVLLAQPDPRYPEVERMIEKRRIAGDVRWHWDIPDRDLLVFYTLADFLALVSLYEGFGFPVLEAMACGTPSLAATGGSLEEVGGDAALYVSPHDVDDIRAGLLRLIEDDKLREALTAKGLQRAKQFSWARAAAEVVRVYREILQ
jgi:glycosyltransferase involved in cell wall biosynthesis